MREENEPHVFNTAEKTDTSVSVVTVDFSLLAAHNRSSVSLN